jgi:F-box protein 11
MQDAVVTQSPRTTGRSWRKRVLVASAVLIVISYASFLVFVFVKFTPRSAAASASAGVSIPGALVVSKSGNGQYKSINAAIAAAPTGATILVRAGVYREVVLIEKEITLVGDGASHAATIECSQGGCVQIIAPTAIVRNFTIRARMGWLERLIKPDRQPAAVAIVDSDAVIEDSDVSSNHGPGIVVAGSDSTPELRNVRVHDCKLNGILFTNASKGIVVDSDIYRNQWAGIRSERRSKPTIRRSRIRGGKMAGVLLDKGGAAIEECEIFENNYAGIHARNGSAVLVRQTRSYKNNGNGLYVGDRSFGKAEATEIFGNKNSGIEVADESDAQLLDIKVHHQETHGIVIWENSTALVEGATVYDNATGLFVASGGKPIIRKSVFRSHFYSAIEIQEGGEPTIETSQVYDGRTSGIYFRSGASGRVQDCAIFGNAMSNIIIAAGSDPEVNKTRLSESGYAGVLVLDGGQGSVTDCEIFNNYLGIEIRTNSTLSVQNSTIRGNHHQGLVADSTSSGSVTGSTLVDNADGAWKIESGSRLVRQGNTE